MKAGPASCSTPECAKVRCENTEAPTERMAGRGAGTCAAPRGTLAAHALGDDSSKLSKICGRPPLVHYSLLSFSYSPGPHFPCLLFISSFFFPFSLPPTLLSFLISYRSLLPLPPPFLRPEMILSIPVLARMWPKHTGSCSPSALFQSEAASFSFRSLGLQGCDLTWVVADRRCIGASWR